MESAPKPIVPTGPAATGNSGQAKANFEQYTAQGPTPKQQDEAIAVTYSVDGGEQKTAELYGPESTVGEPVQTDQAEQSEQSATEDMQYEQQEFTAEQTAAAGSQDIPEQNYANPASGEANENSQSPEDSFEQFLIGLEQFRRLNEQVQAMYRQENHGLAQSLLELVRAIENENKKFLLTSMALDMQIAHMQIEPMIEKLQPSMQEFVNSQFVQMTQELQLLSANSEAFSVQQLKAIRMVRAARLLQIQALVALPAAANDNTAAPQAQTA